MGNALGNSWWLTWSLRQRKRRRSGVGLVEHRRVF